MEKNIFLKIKLDTINKIIGFLGDRKYTEVAGLLNEIMPEFQESIMLQDTFEQSKVLKFIEAIPGLLGIDKKYGHLLGLAYKDELGNPSSPFARKEEDEKNPIDRLELLSMLPVADKKKLNYCKHLLNLIQLNKWKDEGLDVSKSYKESLKIVENASYPDVDVYMTAHEATRVYWEI